MLIVTVFSFTFLVLCRCKTCGEYIYKGKKFNARKETVQNELYMGLPIFRFYIKCTRCLAEITFKVRATFELRLALNVFLHSFYYFVSLDGPREHRLCDGAWCHPKLPGRETD